MDVTFFCPEPERLAKLSALDPHAGWRQLCEGNRSWTVQTYLLLRRAGYDVRLSSQLASEGLVLFSNTQKHQLLRQRRELGRAVLVGIRGDRHDSLFADFEFVQNAATADGRRTFFIPHWCQVDMIPRDPSRGTTLRTLAFKGVPDSLHADFHAPKWRRFLAARGIDWVCDTKGPEGPTESLAWNDYREVDAVLAVRPKRRDLYFYKPATKLYNAWHAGVPALLGPEIAYREMRRSELDYLEVTDMPSAQQAVERLAGDGQLYQRMIDHGRQRAGEFSFEAITERWRMLLFDVLPPLAEARLRHVRLPLLLRRWSGKALAPVRGATAWLAQA